MYLFFDTETTSIPRDHRAAVSDLQNWPSLGQLAWLLIDDEMHEVASAGYIARSLTSAPARGATLNSGD